jgi:Protein of unknown function (DUF3179)
MKKLFYIGVIVLVAFELANVYFIMPMPFSQRARSIDLAYFLYKWRWPIRALCGTLMLGGVGAALRQSGWQRWIAVPVVAVAAVVVYAANFTMSADHMFLAPAHVDMRPATANRVEPGRLVVGVVIDGDARAYPVQFIGYHHQVRDTVSGRSVMVSFCTVCRAGRVFDPTVLGKVESFRLVGMDHFNAMFEDRTTGSWWRQATGEAIAGPRKGTVLGEIPSRQVTLAEWLALHPASLIMQADPRLRDRYYKDFDYETGASRSTLTGTDSVSWRDKAWVVGVALGGESKAYDWNRLRREGVVNDVVGGTPIVLALASDRVSFFAFQRPDSSTRFALRGDSLVAPGRSYALTGRSATDSLPMVYASQEFWHSWRTFHPNTKTY